MKPFASPSVPKLLVAALICVMVVLASLAVWLSRDASGPVKSAPASPSGAAEVSVSAGAIYNVTLTDMHGNRQNLGQWHRKLLVVNFWATWCGPCKEEMPALARLQTKFSHQDVQIIGVAADSPANVVNFAQHAKIDYPLFPDEAGAIAFSKRLGNRLGLLPHTVVFRTGGELIYNRLGVISERELGDIIAENVIKTN